MQGLVNYIIAEARNSATPGEDVMQNDICGT